MLHASDLSGRRATGILSALVGEHREQATIARVEVEMVLVGLSEIGLLEDERHSQAPDQKSIALCFVDPTMVV
jgi:hypothetical protein